MTTLLMTMLGVLLGVKLAHHRVASKLLSSNTPVYVSENLYGVLDVHFNKHTSDVLGGWDDKDIVGTFEFDEESEEV